MAEIDGDWDVTARGAGIERTVRVTLRSVGGAVEGEVRDGDDRYPISGGRLDGDRLEFRMSIAEPIRARLTASLTVDGDRMRGSGRANLLIKVELSGIRVA